MVSLWPFKGDDTSAASFEKTLSSLNTRINKTKQRRDAIRASARRLKALWLLYTSLAYMLYAIILVLVTGTNNWGYVEYGAIAGGPLLIYLVRYALSAISDYRVARAQAQLDALDAQRETAIDKFKTATKYNSTQQLLEKYGASPPQKADDSSDGKQGRPTSSKGRDAKEPQTVPQRTGLPPPPTANIPRRGPDEGQAPPPMQSQPQPQTPSRSAAAAQQQQQQQRPPSPTFGAEFAPNAMDTSAPAQYAGSLTQPHWYDRVLDLLMGEDETKPVNRLALICAKCGLVNGQAPPGVKTIEEVGRWRCMECKASNGAESEVSAMLREVVRADEGDDTRDKASEKVVTERVTRSETRGDRA